MRPIQLNVAIFLSFVIDLDSLKLLDRLPYTGIKIQADRAPLIIQNKSIFLLNNLEV